jgi:hypothetical protein
MPLTNGELDRIRAELGYNLLNVGAEPYIGVAAIFSQVIQPYMREGLDTTVVSSVAADGITTLTLNSAVGIAAHDHVAVDVDSLFEYVTVRHISGSAIGVILAGTHTGNYPVTLDGGLQIVRECLSNIYLTRQKMRTQRGTGALKKVDEIEFHDVRGKSSIRVWKEQLDFWRSELANALGLAVNPCAAGASHGGSVGLY